MKDPIQTHHVYPAIPDRRWDWSACRDPESHVIGWGATEAEALADFARFEAEEECERRNCIYPFGDCDDCPVKRLAP